MDRNQLSVSFFRRGTRILSSGYLFLTLSDSVGVDLICAFNFIDISFSISAQSLPLPLPPSVDIITKPSFPESISKVHPSNDIVVSARSPDVIFQASLSLIAFFRAACAPRTSEPPRYGRHFCA